MISNPEYGWCDFQLGSFEGHPSYLTDVPVDLLNAFIDYHLKGCGTAWFDEEGTEFTMVMNPNSLFLIEEKETSILHDFSNVKGIAALEKELIEDIEKDVDAWATNFSILPEETPIIKKEICQKLEELKDLRNRYIKNNYKIEEIQQWEKD